MREDRSTKPRRWSLEDIPFDAVHVEAIRGDRHYLYLVAAASFVETASDLYTKNLLRYFAGEAEVSAWLEQEWQYEEMQHGAALRRYLAQVWPEFPWQWAFDAFFAAYAPLCDDAHLGPTRALELVARCVIETGTSTTYRMLERASPEPVLSLLVGHIRRDEVRHYKHFLHYFRNYQARERVGRGAVLRSLWERLREINGEDGVVAFESVFRADALAARDCDTAYRVFRRRNAELARAHFPFAGAAKMIVKPLSLAPRLERLASSLLAGGAWLALRS
jgi:rubrerythrin